MDVLYIIYLSININSTAEQSSRPNKKKKKEKKKRPSIELFSGRQKGLKEAEGKIGLAKALTSLATARTYFTIRTIPYHIYSTRSSQPEEPLTHILHPTEAQKPAATTTTGIY